MTDRTLEHLKHFEKKVGAMSDQKTVHAEFLEKYKGVLPDALLTIWKEVGWGAYGEGIFWTVNPSEYSDLLEIWIEDTPFAGLDNYHIIARNAFGDLYAWGQENNQSFTIACSMHALVAQEKKIRTKSDDPDRTLGVFFSSKKKKYLDMKDEQGEPLFDRVLKKLGHLEQDEIYGFKQPLFAGGRLMLDNLIKVKLDQHLTLARQLGGVPKIPFADVSVDI